MSVTVDKLKGLEKKLTVSIPADEFAAAIDKKFKSVSSTIRLPGFRKGKIPAGLIQSRYGQSINSEVIQELISSSLQKALKDKECMPVAVPQVDIKKSEKGEDLVYEAVFEEYPEIKTDSFAKCKVKLQTAEITDADIDTAITAIRQQQADWENTTEKSVKGDQVTVNFVGTIDKKEFEGGTANDFKVILGSGGVLPEFDKALTGVKADSKTKAKLTFPKDYHAKDLAGKKAEFALEVLTVAKPKLPEIDAEFIKKFGVESGELDDFRSQVKQPLEAELEKSLAAVKEKHVFDLLHKQYKKLEVPKKLVEDEIKNSIQRTANKDAESEDIKPGDKHPVAVEAEKNILLSLVCQHLLQDYAIKLDKARFEKYLKSLAGSYMQEDEFLKWFYQDTKRVEQVQATILQMQLIDAILEKVTVTEEKLSFEKLREVA
ncbi:MAG: trigger factor [Pseudomonadota bacterium]|nr:trigger factor [Pseudomonadota bacterium]